MRKITFSEMAAGRSILLPVMVAAIIITMGAITADAAIPRLTDAAISDAVEDELASDPAVPLYRVYVSTADGVVTLKGSVDNILAKERAARIARIVKGVRAVVNLIEVIPPVMRTDTQIHEDVREALMTDPATDSYGIDVLVRDSVVTLSGIVDSWQEKELCATVAKGVRGVKEVKNEIIITRPEIRSDAEIQAEVEAALRWDAFVDHALIRVQVRDGKVLLSGTVGSAAEKRWARRDAFVSGVKSLDDSGLEVERWARDNDLKGQKYEKKSPKEIEKAVKDALLYDPRVLSFKITPEVADDGTTVVLRGVVDNLKAKRAAARDARNTVGVREVENRIRVRPASTLSDQRIQDRVRRALLRDPYLESHEISVSARNGVVDLYGSVDSYFEKLKAEDAASKVNGVIMVDNNLMVQGHDAPYIYDPYLDGSYLNDVHDYRPPFSEKGDVRIKADIEEELFWSPFVDADDVHVAVQGGVATLTGTVDSWSEYNAAADNAYEGGAIYVRNDLKIR